ncbi:MAG: single-stranded DNA-binding protein [Nitrospiraceae bacterium]
MHNKSDTNQVSLTGRIHGEPVVRIIPPGCTIYVHFELSVRGEWPDHTGSAVLLEYRHVCFAQGPAAEAILWASNGDHVGLIGSLDMIVGDYEPAGTAPIYKPAIRIHTMRPLNEEE